MRVGIEGHVIATGDCGHQIKIPVTRLEDDFTCSECGAVDRYTPEQAARVRAKLVNSAKDVGVAAIREQFERALNSGGKRGKNIVYRRK